MFAPCHTRFARIRQLSQCAAALSIFLTLAIPARALDAASPEARSERSLIQIIQSGSPPGDKAVACKRLAIYGTSQAVPVLAPLLSDPELSSWALIALEAIPGPEADKVLRKAAAHLHGELLTGVVGTIGVRRDPEAVEVLSPLLADRDAHVYSAAAISLGKIGTTKAASVLRRALDKSSPDTRPIVAEGCVRCAEHLLADGKRSDAVKLYDAVCAAPVPRPKLLEGLRGAVLARGSSGIPLMLVQLQSQDRDFFNLGLRLARELPGNDATTALIAAYRRFEPSRQPLFLQALADRNEPATLAVVKEAANQGDKDLKLAAVGVLDRMGDATALDVLLNDACDDDADISRASLAALARVGGAGVDTRILAKLPDSTGKMRKALLVTAASRGIESSLPSIVQALNDPDPEVRRAAAQALGAIGGPDQVAELARALEKSDDPKERTQIKTVLVSLSGKAGAKCVPALLPLTHSANVEDKKAALQALMAAGGSDALAAVASASEDGDTALASEAVRTLNTWPNTWPDDVSVLDVLLHVSKNDANQSHVILALRGYLQFLLGAEKMPADVKLEKTEKILPQLQRPQEKTTAMSVLQSIPSSRAIDLLVSYAEDPSVADDACAALVEASSKKQSSLPVEVRKKALTQAAEKSTNEETKRKAQAALKNLE